MDALPYYKWYWTDYRANRKVQKMSWQAKGLYREMLDEFWSEGIIPDDFNSLADICSCTHDEIELYWPQIAHCWERVEGGYVNRKMDEQRTAKDAHRAKMAAAGRGGAFAKMALANASKSLANAGKSQGDGIQVYDNNEKSGKSLAIASKSHIAEQSRAEQSRMPPESIARKFQHEAAVFGDKELRILTEVCRREQALGIPPDDIVTAMVDSWRDFTGSSQKLEYSWGAEKFFGQGYWKNKPGWPWKEGLAPKPERHYVNGKKS